MRAVGKDEVRENARRIRQALIDNVHRLPEVLEGLFGSAAEEKVRAVERIQGWWRSRRSISSSGPVVFVRPQNEVLSDRYDITEGFLWQDLKAAVAERRRVPMENIVLYNNLGEELRDSDPVARAHHGRTIQAKIGGSVVAVTTAAAAGATPRSPTSRRRRRGSRPRSSGSLRRRQRRRGSWRRRRSWRS